MRRLALLVPFCLGASVGPALLPQDAVAQKMERQEPEAEKLTGRLPNYYGKVDVSDEQRQNIYRIQADYEVKIESLLDEIEQLRTDRDEKVAAVLTDEQRAAVERLEAEARAKRTAR